jgi:hypothetical protein
MRTTTLLLLYAVPLFASYQYHHQTWVQEWVDVLRSLTAYGIVVGLPIIFGLAVWLVCKLIKYGWIVVRNFFVAGKKLKGGWYD